MKVITWEHWFELIAQHVNRRVPSAQVTLNVQPLSLLIVLDKKIYPVVRSRSTVPTICNCVLNFVHTKHSYLYQNALLLLSHYCLNKLLSENKFVNSKLSPLQTWNSPLYQVLEWIVRVDSSIEIVLATCQFLCHGSASSRDPN